MSLVGEGPKRGVEPDGFLQQRKRAKISDGLETSVSSLSVEVATQPCRSQ